MSSTHFTSSEKVCNLPSGLFLHISLTSKLLFVVYVGKHLTVGDMAVYRRSRRSVLYLRRRFNMNVFKGFPPHSSVGEGPFCLYASHTQPESSIDVAGSYFADQIALINFISRSLPVSHELYVKIHPTDVDGKSFLFY